jgi:hypothetical protein
MTGVFGKELCPFRIFLRVEQNSVSPVIRPTTDDSLFGLPVNTNYRTKEHKSWFSDRAKIKQDDREGNRQ